MTRWDTDNLNAAHTQRELEQEFGCNLIDQLREVTGGKLAYTNTSNALRLKAADKIEQLERELVEARGVIDAQANEIIRLQNDLADSRERGNALFETYELLGESWRAAHVELSAEKALADRLWDSLQYFNAFRNGNFDITVGEAYRKARGL